MMNARRTAILLFLVFGLGLLAGLNWSRASHRADLADLRASAAENQRLAARAASKRLQDAQDLGDALTQQLAVRDRQINTLIKERRDALRKVTSGRACLGTDALRVLDGAPGLRVANLPETTNSAADSDGRAATDSDLAGWALEAGASYERCRSRLSALIDWHARQPARTKEEQQR